MSLGMLTYLWIAVGSAIGGVTRFWLTGVAARHLPVSFPWGTLIVNVTGSFAIGFFASITTSHEGRDIVPLSFKQFFMVGICGGYTTFSAFSLQTLTLARGGEWLYAGANTVLSVIFCLVAVWLGHVAANLFGAR